MSAVYKLNQSPSEYNEKLYSKLIVLNSRTESIRLSEPQYRLNTNGTDEYDIDEKEGKIPVQPLIGNEIQRAKSYLLNKPERYKGSNLKNYTLFCLGICTGLRISDLLEIKIFKVVKNGEIKDSMIITEQKTGNEREIFLRQSIKQILVDYINSIENWKYNYYLFYPRSNYYKKMGRHNVNAMMKDIEKKLGLDIPLGTHSLRKTFARAVYDLMMSKGDIMAIEKLQNVLGHKDVSTTRRYIGLQREGNRDIYLDEDLCID